MTLNASDEISFEVSQAKKMNNIVSDGSFINDSYKCDPHENEDSIVVQIQQHQSPPHSPCGSTLANMLKVYSLNNEEINGIIYIDEHEYIVSNHKTNRIQENISSVEISLNNNVEDEISNNQMEVQISLTNNSKDSIDEKHLEVKLSSNGDLEDDINKSIVLCDQEYYSCEESEHQPLFNDNQEYYSCEESEHQPLFDDNDHDNLSTQFQSNNNLNVTVHQKQKESHYLQSNIPKEVSNEFEKMFVTPNPFEILALQSEQKLSKRSRKRRTKK